MYLSCKIAIGGGGGGGSRGHPFIANYFHCLRTTLFNHFKVICFLLGLFLCIFLTESTVISFQRLLLTTIQL